MTSQMLRRFLAVLTFSFISTAIACGQSQQTISWQTEAAFMTAKRTIQVVTIAHPKRRHPCVVESMNAKEIVCMHLGHTTAYRAEDVVALIEPGSHSRWYLYSAGFGAAAVAATWGTVVLAAICPPCAVATGIAALFLYWMVPGSAMMTDGDSPDKLLYLAPGQKLQVRLD